MSSAIAFAGLTKARAMLTQLAASLRAAASGQVVDRAAEKVEEQIDAVASRRLNQHRDTGAAASSLTVSRSGGLVQLVANRYLDYHGWWPFRRGMPPFVINRAVKIFEAELVAVLSGKPSPLALADAEEDAKEEARAEKSRAKFKRDTARIARRERLAAARAAKERG